MAAQVIRTDIFRAERAMPRGPKGEQRPADVIGAAVKVMRIATGEEPEGYGSDHESGCKDPAAVALGRKGGKARAEVMTANRRKEIARKAAQSRWGKKS
jgi:hypothetical protein